MIVVMAVIMVMGVLVMLVAAAAVLAELVVMVVMLVNMVLTVFMLMLVIFTMVMVVLMLVILTMVVLMMLMIVMMVQALFLFAAHGDLHVGPGDAAFNGRLGLEDYARYAETVELVYKSLRIGQKLQKGGGQHVSGGSHAAVKV